MLLKEITFSLMFLLVIAIIMVLFRPGIEDYNKWVAENYSIYCSSLSSDCYRPDEDFVVTHQEPIILLQSELKNRFVFITVEKRFEDYYGNVLEVKAAGILGLIIPLEEKSL